MPKNFGKRVLRVRLYPDAESEIALAAEAAVLGLQASRIRAILDRVPRGFSPDAVNVTWTDDPEESRFVTLWAGDDGLIARQLAEAFAYAFRGARGFIEMYERVNATSRPDGQQVQLIRATLAQIDQRSRAVAPPPTIPSSSARRAKNAPAHT